MKSVEATIQRNEEDEQQSLQTQLDKLLRTTRILNKQVDILQINAESHERPWYKNASVLVSLLAVVVTVLITSFNVYQQSQGITEKSIKDKQSNIRAAITKLVEARKENIILMQRANTNDRDQLDILINSQRQFLLEDVKVMIDELGVEANTNSLLILGYELQTDADYKTALNYFERALKSAQDDSVHSDQVVALRSLANFRMMPNTGYSDYKKSQDYWHQVIVLQKTKKDEYGLFNLGSTYLNWSNSENLFGNKDLAVDLLNRARKAYESMDPRNPMQKKGLYKYNHLLEYISKTVIPIGINLLVGEWQLVYPGRNDPTTRLQIMSNPNNGLYLTGETISQRGLVIQQIKGQVTFTGVDTLRIDWQGAKVEGRVINPLQGSITLKQVGAMEFKGIESVLGTLATKVILNKSIKK